MFEFLIFNDPKHNKLRYSDLTFDQAIYEIIKYLSLSTQTLKLYILHIILSTKIKLISPRKYLVFSL